MLKHWATFALILATVFLTRSLWPAEVEVIVPPKIVTQWDTVAKLDTVWRTRLVERTHWDTTYLERVTMAEPETLQVNAFMVGFMSLYVGKNVGDSMIVDGFFQGVNPHTGFVERKEWRARWWVAGPLEAVSLDTFPPRASFYDPPKPVKPCGLACKLTYVAAGVVMAKAIDVLAQD